MAEDLALTGALVVDGTGARPRENVTIVLRDGRIASVGGPVPATDAEVIDLHGKTLLPGLIDAHTHLSSLDQIPAWVRDRGRRLGESARLTVEAARKEGAAIAMGADAPPQGGNAQELVRLADAGLTPLEALTAATGVAARACRVDGLVGTLEPGKAADLIVVDGNPMTDLRILTDPRRLWLVLQGGMVTARCGALVS